MHEQNHFKAQIILDSCCYEVELRNLHIPFTCSAVIFLHLCCGACVFYLHVLKILLILFTFVKLTFFLFFCYLLVAIPSSRDYLRNLTHAMR